MVKYAHFDAPHTSIDNIHLNVAYSYSHNAHSTQNCIVDHSLNNGCELFEIYYLSY
jgi:hypothetical protein